MDVIKIENLVKKYKDNTAVKGISFQVNKGEVFGILGPNGAGKTTTLEIIETLKKQTSGNCIVLGFDNLKSPDQIKKRIGVQLQSSEYFRNLSIAELLILFASLYGDGISPSAALAKVNLEEKLNSQVKELSGGQKQRFTIATALVHKPEILFLDEPTTGLDPQARRGMWSLIRELNDQGITIVMTTHYMEEAELLCDRIAIMDKGEILKIDSPRTLIESLAKGYKLSFYSSKHIDEQILKSIPGVSAVVLEHPRYILDVAEPETLGDVIEALKKANLPYSFLNLKTASLEDVYLKLTGRAYQE